MIAIVDYGLGNVQAFANIYSRLNIPACIAKTEEDLCSAEKLILPGVGSFDGAMKRLTSSGMRGTISDLVLRDNVPILGVCVGMQMMAISSEEGNESGLGWLDAYVKKLSFAENMPVPHMGWNNVDILLDNPLASAQKEWRFYFLHSYYFSPNKNEIKYGVTNYGGSFTSMAFQDNIFGVQFHPEKSHQFGINLLENFAKL